MILTKQSEKVDDRMEGVTIDTPKEKLGTPGFLRSIGSIFSKLSPKQFQRRPKLPQPTDAIQVDDSQPSSEEDDLDEGRKISSSATVATSGKRVPTTSRELHRWLGPSSTRKNGRLARRPALQSSSGAFSSPTAVLISPSFKRFRTSRHGSEP